MYTGIKEVEIEKSSELIKDHFQAAYRKQFKVAPFLEDTDNAAFSFLSRNYGLEKSRVIIDAFVRMQDKWFIENGYSPGVIRKNINKILIAAGSRLNAAETQGTDLRIATDILCDCCGEYYRWVGWSRDLEKPRYCEACVTSDRPNEPLTKEDLDELSALLKPDA